MQLSNNNKINQYDYLFRTKVLECSAKDDHNVMDLFKNLLTLSRIIPAGSNESTTGLKRRSSAYVSATSKGRLSITGMWMDKMVNLQFLAY